VSAVSTGGAGPQIEFAHSVSVQFREARDFAKRRQKSEHLKIELRKATVYPIQIVNDPPLKVDDFKMICFVDMNKIAVPCPYASDTKQWYHNASRVKGNDTDCGFRGRCVVVCV
jgi:hypothetical protein